MIRIPHRLFVAAVITFSPAISLAQISDETALHEMAKSQSYVEASRPQSIETYRKLVAIAPQKIDYRAELATNLYYLKRHSEALQELEAIPADQRSREIRELRAELLLRSDKHAEARAEYQRLRDEKETPAVLLGLARSNYALGNRSQALDYYKTFAERGGSQLKPYEYAEAGGKIAGEGDKVVGEKILRDGIKKYPQNPDIRLALGTLLVWRGQEAEGLKLLEGLTKATPDIQKARITALLKTGKQQEALTLLSGYQGKDRARFTADSLAEYVDSCNTEEFDAMLRAVAQNSVELRAQLLAQRGLKFEALQILEGLSNPGARELRIRILAEGERYGEAISVAETSDWGRSDDVRVATQLAVAYEKTGNPSKLQELRQEFEKRTPVFLEGASPTGANLLGVKAGAEKASPLSTAYKLLESKQYLAAKESFTQYKATHPTSISATSGLAFAALGLEDFDGAESLARDILARVPNHRDATLALARAEYYRGDRARALESYFQLVGSGNHKDEVALAELARLQLWEGEFDNYLQTKKSLEGLNYSAYLLPALEAHEALRRGRAKTTRDYASAHNEPALHAEALCALGCPKNAVGALSDANIRNSYEERILGEAELLANTRAGLEVAYWEEQGGTRSADVKRATLPVASVESWLNDGLRVGAAVSNVRETFDVGPDLTSLEAQFSGKLALSSGLSLGGTIGFRQTSEDYVDDPIFGEAGLMYRFDFPLTLAFKYARVNEFSNSVAIIDGTQSDRYQLRALGSYLDSFTYAAGVDLIDYSDDNSGHYEFAQAGVRLLDSAVELWFDNTAEYRNTDELTTLRADGDNLVPELHPYWTPDNYFSWTTGLRIRKQLGFESYCSVPQYIEAAVRGKFDTDSNSGIELAANFVRRIGSRVELSVGGLIHRSQDWDASAAHIGIGYRF